ncbi:hypothetical protein L195_g024064, partial [Trifolium pratense]
GTSIFAPDCRISAPGTKISAPGGKTEGEVTILLKILAIGLYFHVMTRGGVGVAEAVVGMRGGDVEGECQALLLDVSLQAQLSDRWLGLMILTMATRFGALTSS